MAGNRETTGVSEAIRLALGGYVLGALSVEEDEQVRAHLQQCAECRAEHAKLAGLPALLGTITEAEAAGEAPPAPSEDLADRIVRRAENRPGPPQSAAPLRQPEEKAAPAGSGEGLGEGPGEELLDRLLGQAAATRRTKRWHRRLAAAGAALVLVAGVAGGTWLAASSSIGSRSAPPGVSAQAPARTLSAKNPATGVSATVKIYQAAWGSAVQAAVKGIPANDTCTLQAVRGEGAPAVGATWMAGSTGGTTVIPGAVPMAPADITQIDIYTDNGQKLLLAIPA